jgi:S-sulfosulfanyl-L-cysteine sulfohydrolase
MSKSWTRRNFMASASLTAVGLAVAAAGFAAAEVDFPARTWKGKRVRLLHFTDTHAQLETHPEYLPGASPEIQMMGGYARLKTAIEGERASGDGPCFLLDGGDDFQGSGPATWSEGEVVLDPLNALSPDVFVPGNWEAAYGPERFKRTMARLKCPVVCYNFHDTASGARLFAPSVTLDRDGVKVAFVGITDISASTRHPPAEFQGMDTTRMEGLRDFVKELRARERPDLVVAVTHTGISISRQIARETPEFDVILSGHTHERTTRPILEGKVIIVEPGCFGSFLGRLDVYIGDSGVAHHDFRLIPILEWRYDEEPHVKALVDKSLAPYRDRMSRAVGRTEALLMRYDVLESTADDFITDAIRKAAKADIGFSNGFRFGPPVLPTKVTEADLWNFLPMDARMKTGWVTGKELRSYLENELELVFSKDPWKLSGGWGPRASGLAITFNALAEHGRRLVSVKVSGREIEDEQRFMIAGCVRGGEPVDVICRHSGTHDAHELPLTVHEAIKEFFRTVAVIAPQRNRRETALDLPSRVFSQDAVISTGGDLSGAPTTPSGLPRG